MNVMVVDIALMSFCQEDDAVYRNLCFEKKKKHPCDLTHSTNKIYVRKKKRGKCDFSTDIAVNELREVP